MGVTLRRNGHDDVRTVLLTDAADGRWVLARVRWQDRALAGWRQLTLDAQLAAGHPSASNRLLAVRAAMLVTPSRRRDLACDWENLLARAVARSPVPVRRPVVLAAEADIRELIAALRAALPVPARGVAMANLLLTQGTSPVHDVRRADLQARVRDATAHLTPPAPSRTNSW